MREEISIGNQKCTLIQSGEALPDRRKLEWEIHRICNIFNKFLVLRTPWKYRACNDISYQVVIRGERDGREEVEVDIRLFFNFFVNNCILYYLFDHCEDLFPIATNFHLEHYVRGGVTNARITLSARNVRQCIAPAKLLADAFQCSVQPGYVHNFRKRYRELWARMQLMALLS